MRIEAVQGDITTEAVDAIVNAADERLAGGGGSTVRSIGRPGRRSCGRLHDAGRLPDR